MDRNTNLSNVHIHIQITHSTRSIPYTCKPYPPPVSLKSAHINAKKTRSIAKTWLTLILVPDQSDHPSATDKVVLVYLRAIFEISLITYNLRKLSLKNRGFLLSITSNTVRKIVQMRRRFSRFKLLPPLRISFEIFYLLLIIKVIRTLYKI